jgi:carbonic anhydrase/acetyltransferase-like protein (isoleucine patch superfamily)
MIKSYCGKMPKIAESALISDTACIIGDVEIGVESSVWPGAVIRADLSDLQPEPGTKIGRNCHIEDSAVVHGVGLIGNNVVIGHGAVVEAFKIGDSVLIGANATILHSVEIGSFSIIAAGSVVLQGMRIPARSFVAGTPAKVKGDISAEQLRYLEETQTGMMNLVMEYKANSETP